MLLRASSQHDGLDYDLAAVNSTGADAGVPHSHWLRQLTEQAIRGEWDQLRDTLSAASQAMGRQEAVDTLTVAAAFNGITRVADATGIPLDDNTAATTADMRADVGIDDFEYAAKAARYAAPADATL